MARIVSTVLAIAAMATLAGCDQPEAKGKDAQVHFPTPIVRYADALKRRANALFGDTLEKRAGVAGDRAANQARNALTTGDYRKSIGDCDEDTEGDCAGHDAGFAFARLHKIENPETCPNEHGEAFEDGCRAYGEAIQGARDDAHSAVMNGKEPQ